MHSVYATFLCSAIIVISTLSHSAYGQSQRYSATRYLAQVKKKNKIGKKKRLQKKRKKKQRVKKKKPRNKKGLWIYGAIGFPHPITIGLLQKEGKVTRGGELGYYQQKVNAAGQVKDVNLQIFKLAGLYRQHPIKNDPIFWGIASGFHQFQVDGKQRVKSSTNGTPLDLELDVSTKIQALYITPHGGLAWDKGKWRIGFSVGYLIPIYSQGDIGIQLTGDSTIDSAVKNTASYREIETDLEKLGAKAGRLGLPVLHILEVSKQW